MDGVKFELNNIQVFRWWMFVHRSFGPRTVWCNFTVFVLNAVTVA